MATLASANTIPSVITDGRVYLAGDVLLGIANVELPEMKYKTESVEGLGIGGTVDVPVPGHFDALSVKFTWLNTTADAFKLLSTLTVKQIEVRADIQVLDSATDTYVGKPLKLVLHSMPKSFSLGKIEPGTKQENEMEMEVLSVALWINGERKLNIDKLNMICEIDGVDQLLTTRLNLGMA